MHLAEKAAPELRQGPSSDVFSASCVAPVVHLHGCRAAYPCMLSRDQKAGGWGDALDAHSLQYSGRVSPERSKPLQSCTLWGAVGSREIRVKYVKGYLTHSLMHVGCHLALSRPCQSDQGFLSSPGKRSAYVWVGRFWHR